MPASYCLKSMFSPAPSLTSSADCGVVGYLRPDRFGLDIVVAGGLHVVSEVGVGAGHRGCRLVQLHPLGSLAFSSPRRRLRRAEVALVLQRALRGSDRLDERPDALQ